MYFSTLHNVFKRHIGAVIMILHINILMCCINFVIIISMCIYRSISVFKLFLMDNKVIDSCILILWKSVRRLCNEDFSVTHFIWNNVILQI